jgi:hypothetical protein
VAYVRVLQQETRGARVLAFGVPAADCNEPFGIFSLNSLMALNPPRVFEMYMRYTDAPPGVFMTAPRRLPPEAVLDRANIAFLGTYSSSSGFIREAKARGYRQRFDDRFVALFERTTSPRFFYSSEYRVVGRDVALAAIATVPSREIVLEEEPGFASTTNAPTDPPVHVAAYRRNSITLTVDAPRPGLLYASESFFGGWSALVNGASARILPANYAFRAVAVPPGRARIEFRYWPPGLTAGLVISTTSAVLLLALVLTGTVRPTTAATERRVRALRRERTSG